MLIYDCCLQPARPGFHTLHHPMSPTGSTPNLAANTSPFHHPHHWSSTTHLAQSPYNDPRAYNTIPHSGGMWPGAHPMHYNTMPDQKHRTNYTIQETPGAGGNTYASHKPDAPPLGYIVAYTPEQIADLMKDQAQNVLATHGYTNPHKSRYPTHQRQGSTGSPLVIHIQSIQQLFWSNTI